MSDSKDKTIYPKPFLKWAGGKTQLLKEISKDVKINESESSFFILLKSSKNISDILQLLYESSKEVNYNNKTIIQINDFNINHFKNKKCFEFTSEQINKYLSVFSLPNPSAKFLMYLMHNILCSSIFEFLVSSDLLIFMFVL